jgi:3-dehydroquinate dehydratase / shikimate dehydrogenase
MKIETKRLILRPWKESDLNPFAALNADPRVMKYFPKTLTIEETQQFITVLKSKFEKDGFSFFATELKSTGEFIGMIGLSIPSYETPFTPCVEIGWRIAYEHWNKGYATEGALACLDFGFNELKLKKIVSFTAVENKTSQRIMEKIGMNRVEDGDFDHPRLPEGHPLRRHVLYSMNKL